MGADAARVVGDFEILEPLGRGSMGFVYLARQADIERLVALKELHAETFGDPSAPQRFVQEAIVAAEFNHPNVVTVYDYLEAGGTAYIAMEYVPGGSLRALVGRLTLEQVAGALEGLLSGLAEAERLGVVHRDVKPENLLITEQGAVKIADFGIAKALREAGRPELTAVGTTVGTPAYMAPEQAMDAELGPWTDLYATGAIAYELLVGRVPFSGENPTAVLLKHVNDPPVPPVWLRPDLDARLCVWVERLLAKNPALRPQTAEEAWYALEEIVVALAGARWRRRAALPFTPRVPSPPDDGGGYVTVATG